MFNGFVLDIESDGFLFESTKIWTICITDIDTNEKFKINPFKDVSAKEKLVNFISKYENPIVAFHNGLGFDMFVLRCLLDIDFNVGPDYIEGMKVIFVDTFYLSMFLLPDRVGHSIATWGDKLGTPKIDWREKAIELGLISKDSQSGYEFKQYHSDMDVYCERDVDVNLRVFLSLMEEWKELYGDLPDFEFPQHFKAGQKSFFLMACQEYSGWKFDQELAVSLKTRIYDMMEQIRLEVEPMLPARALKKTEEKEYKMPAKPFKQDGTYSSSWHNFVNKHKGLEDGDMWVFYGKKYAVEAGKILDVRPPMQISNQDQMKDLFLSNGWIPTYYNYQRGDDGQLVRDPVTRQLVRTSPKMQEAQKLCPNLEKLDGPLVKQVVKWLSLRNRQSVLEGWMTNPRLTYDGRIGAGRSGIAATHRQKHRVVVNVPKASDKVLLGKEFRSLWVADSNMLIAAGDAAALEGRVQGAYTYKYDGGATARELLNGDIHSKTAKSVYKNELKDFDITLPSFNKDHPIFKPYRDRSKNIFYAGLYGAGDAKIASVAGLPEKQGKEISEKFWAANPATKELKDSLEKYWENQGKKKYLPAIDGRILHTRKKSALLNTIFQSCGGIAMDYACCFMDSWLGKIHFDEYRRPYYSYKGFTVRRIGYMHDEMEFECDEEIAEEVSKMIEKSIEDAGKLLKLKVPLAGEGKIGYNWCEVH